MSRTFRMSVVVLSAVAVLSAAAGAEYSPGEFATSVVEYVEGSGVRTDSRTGQAYSDPNAALGRPTVDTQGDGFYIPPNRMVPIVPICPPLRSYEVVTIGNGGRLVLQFDHPVWDDPQNPYGIDLIVFGNAFQTIGGEQGWDGGDPSQIVVGAACFSEPGLVSVSQDGSTWYTFDDGPFADDFAPTLGRIYDPSDPDESLGEWNDWWGRATNPTYPLDPAVTADSLAGMTLAQVAQAYYVSAGGTGFDLAWLGVQGLDWIRYVRIESPPSGATTEIDAVADVAASVKGDANWDLLVDIQDLTCLASNWGRSSVGWSEGDFTFDGRVDIQDLTALASNWGHDGRFGQPGGTVPEPASLVLMVLAALGALRTKV